MEFIHIFFSSLAGISSFGLESKMVFFFVHNFYSNNFGEFRSKINNEKIGQTITFQQRYKKKAIVVLVLGICMGHFCMESNCSMHIASIVERCELFPHFRRDNIKIPMKKWLFFFGRKKKKKKETATTVWLENFFIGFVLLWADVKNWWNTHLFDPYIFEEEEEKAHKKKHIKKCLAKKSMNSIAQKLLWSQPRIMCALCKVMHCVHYSPYSADFLCVPPWPATSNPNHICV